MSFLIYVMSIADDINFVCSLMLAIGGIGLVLAVVGCFASEGEARIVSLTKKLVLGLVITAIVGILVPNSKQLAAMYLVPKIVNNEKVQDITGKAANVFELKLDEWIKDLSEEKGKE